MKKVILVLLFIAVLLVAGCVDTIGTSTTGEAFSETGITTTNSGLTFEGVSAFLDGDFLLGNEIKFGSEVVLYFDEIKGLTEQGGNTFPGASMIVIDSKGKEVLRVNDVYAEYSGTGIPKKSTEAIALTFTTGPPMVAGETYSVSGRIWDKKGEGEITFKVDIKTKGAAVNWNTQDSDTDPELIGKWKYVRDSETSFMEFMNNGKATVTLPEENPANCTYFLEGTNLSVDCPTLPGGTEEYVYSISDDVLKLTTDYLGDAFFSRVE